MCLKSYDWDDKAVWLPRMERLARELMPRLNPRYTEAVAEQAFLDRDYLVAGVSKGGIAPSPVFSPPRIQARLSVASVEPPSGPPSKFR